jgi:hypothetical protein
MLPNAPSSPRFEIAYYRALTGGVASVGLAVVGLVFVPALHPWLPLLLANAGLMFVMAEKLRNGSANAWATLTGVTAWKAAIWIVVGISDLTAPGEIFPMASALYLPMGLNKLVELGIYFAAMPSLRRSKRAKPARPASKVSPDQAQ